MCQARGIGRVLSDDDRDPSSSVGRLLWAGERRHHSISGHPLTDQHALELAVEIGAHVICEHTVTETWRGDSLIAVASVCGSYIPAHRY
jgi:hypothetical protein